MEREKTKTSNCSGKQMSEMEEETKTPKSIPRPTPSKPVENDEVSRETLKPKKGKRRESSENETVVGGSGETFKAVCCSVCSTEVGVIDEDEIYQLFNVLPSKS